MPSIAFYVNLVESRYVTNFQDRYFHRYMFLHFDYDYIPLLFDTIHLTILIYKTCETSPENPQINYFVLVPFRDKNAISISSFLLSPIGEEA